MTRVICPEVFPSVLRREFFGAFGAGHWQRSRCHRPFIASTAGRCGHGPSGDVGLSLIRPGDRWRPGADGRR